MTTKTFNDRIAAALSDLANTNIAHCKAQLAHSKARDRFNDADKELTAAGNDTIAAYKAAADAKAALGRIMNEQAKAAELEDWSL